MPRILVVEDEEDLRYILTENLMAGGYEVIEATNGRDAIEKCRNSIPDLILSDIRMPEMGGIELFYNIKNFSTEIAAVPFIFLTAVGGDEAEIEGLRIGSDGYLTKPVKFDLLLATIESRLKLIDRHSTFLHTKLRALFGQQFDNNEYARGEFESFDSLIKHYAELAEEYTNSKLTRQMVDAATFKAQTLDDAHTISRALASFCPDPQSAVMGLSELLLNAIEHGNLGIGYELKTELLNNGTWHQEIERRVSLPENADKFVTINFKQTPDALMFKFTDCGNGFEFEPYLEVDLSRRKDFHGRGIAVSNAISFTRIVYQGLGNEVVAEISLN